jgi:hypothetical protein
MSFPSMRRIGDMSPSPQIKPLPKEGFHGVDSFSVARITDVSSFADLLGAFYEVEAEHHPRPSYCWAMPNASLNWLNQTRSES